MRRGTNKDEAPPPDWKSYRTLPERSERNSPLWYRRDDRIARTRVCCRVTKRTLQTKKLPPYTSVGGKFFYRESDVAEYLESKTVKNKQVMSWDYLNSESEEVKKAFLQISETEKTLRKAIDNYRPSV